MTEGQALSPQMKWGVGILGGNPAGHSQRLTGQGRAEGPRAVPYVWGTVWVVGTQQGIPGKGPGKQGPAQACD